MPTGTGFSRRQFIVSSAVSLGFAGLARAVQEAATPDPRLASLVPPADGPLALPPGFTQTVLSRTGDAMDDGLLVPGLADGMGVFAGDGGKVLLVRNHEIGPEHPMAAGAFGPKLERLWRLDPKFLFDAGYGKTPILGGTTTLVYDPQRRRIERQWLSLAGTGRNCAGGVTPWGTWITCEEWAQGEGEVATLDASWKAAGGVRCERNHGWCFEVRAADRTIAVPRRLPALGRFKHEAVAVDPTGRFCYLTEDVEDGCLYRFVADKPGDFTAGGRLQALGARERPSLDVRNWPAVAATDKTPAREASPSVPQGSRFAARWIDLDETDAPNNDLRLRAFAAGAMRFARCEGIWWSPEAVYVAATTGGPGQLGQIWAYRPSPAEGTPGEADRPGEVELMIQSQDGNRLKNADNLTVAPWGELFICEDGAGRDGIVTVRPDGTVRRFALNVFNEAELAGLGFSADGSTLFANVQKPGITLAIHGDFAAWRAARG